MLYKIKKLIKEKFPKVFNFLKSVKRILVVPQERFDPRKPFAELDYFNKYSQIILRDVYGHVLDIGSGYGYLTKKIAGKNNVLSVVALDKIFPQSFRFLNEKKIKYIKCDLTNINTLPSYSEYFDVVSSTEFIEHISEESFINLVSYILKSLKSGGIFIGSTPVNLTDKEKFSDSPFHVREYQTNSFKQILDRVGFKDIEIEIHGDFFSWKAKK